MGVLEKFKTSGSVQCSNAFFCLILFVQVTDWAEKCWVNESVTWRTILSWSDVRVSERGSLGITRTWYQILHATCIVHMDQL